jgi:hypothetical protein
VKRKFYAEILAKTFATVKKPLIFSESTLYIMYNFHYFRFYFAKPAGRLFEEIVSGFSKNKYFSPKTFIFFPRFLRKWKTAFLFQPYFLIFAVVGFVNETVFFVKKKLRIAKYLHPK